MTDYNQKFQDSISNSNYSSLDSSKQKIIYNLSSQYRLSFQDIRQLIDIQIDLSMWDEDGVELFLDKEYPTRKLLMGDIKKYYLNLKERTKTYKNFSHKHKIDNKLIFEVQNKENIGLGSCPVASPKTRCCNLLTLDAVESCGFDCSYCSIQSFYNQNKIVFDSGFKEKLDNLNLDPNQIYHIGTGQSSDSLMWGNREGVLDSLVDFAKQNSNVILEFKTKSDNIKYFLDNDIPKNIIVTWSLNTQTIIDNEEHYTASLENRIKSARALANKGILVGFHFHPIVVYDGYLDEYEEIYKTLIDRFESKEVVMVSLGTLTFIKPVIQKLRDRNFKTKILQMPMVDASGKQSYPLDIKKEMFSHAYKTFEPWHKDVYFYMCMEDHSLWKDVFGYEYSSNYQMEEMMKISYLSKINNID
jgi:spore photoproduct lyase